MVFFLSLTQTAEIAIFTFPGILCLAECFFLAEYLLQESVQPFAKLVFEESEVVDRYLGLSWRSHFDDRGVAFGSCPVDVEQGSYPYMGRARRGYILYYRFSRRTASVSEDGKRIPEDYQCRS